MCAPPNTGPLRRKKGPVFLVQSSRMSKKKDKKNKCAISKANKLTGGIKKDKGICHYYDKEGHWRRNCKEYLATVKV